VLASTGEASRTPSTEAKKARGTSNDLDIDATYLKGSWKVKGHSARAQRAASSEDPRSRGPRRCSPGFSFVETLTARSLYERPRSGSPRPRHCGSSNLVAMVFGHLGRTRVPASRVQPRTGQRAAGPLRRLPAKCSGRATVVAASQPRYRWSKTWRSKKLDPASSQQVLEIMQITWKGPQYK